MSYIVATFVNAAFCFETSFSYKTALKIMTSWLIYDVILAHDDVIMYLNDKSYEVQTPKIINSNKYLGSNFAVTIIFYSSQFVETCGGDRFEFATQCNS